MPAAPVTEAEVAAILVGPLVIDQAIRWSYKSDTWAEASVPVDHPRRGVQLSLTITINLEVPTKFSFSLLINRGIRIIGLDGSGSHANTHTDRNKWVRQTHEHRWTDACHGSWAYSVTYPADLESAFRDFCRRHGITFNGIWIDPPPVQLGLEEL